MSHQDTWRSAIIASPSAAIIPNARRASFEMAEPAAWTCGALASASTSRPAYKKKAQEIEALSRTNDRQAQELPPRSCVHERRGRTAHNKTPARSVDEL